MVCHFINIRSFDDNINPTSAGETALATKLTTLIFYRYSDY